MSSMGGVSMNLVGVVSVEILGVGLVARGP